MHSNELCLVLKINTIYFVYFLFMRFFIIHLYIGHTNTFVIFVVFFILQSFCYSLNDLNAIANSFIQWRRLLNAQFIHVTKFILND